MEQCITCDPKKTWQEITRKDKVGKKTGSSSRDLVWTHSRDLFRAENVTSIWGINPGHFEEAGGQSPKALEYVVFLHSPSTPPKKTICHCWMNLIIIFRPPPSS